MSQRVLFARVLHAAIVGMASLALLLSANGEEAQIRETQAHPTVCLSELVPLYVHPSHGTAWSRLAAKLVQSKQVERVLILNPSSGPGHAASAEFRDAVTAAKQAGNKIYGYISTRYGKVNPEKTHAEVREYAAWYGVDGIFVDEVSAKSADVGRYYQPLATFITATIKSGGVILNNGTYPDASYAEIKVPKESKLQMVIFEDSYTAFTKKSFAVPAWVRRYPASMFVDIVHSTPEDRVGQVLGLSVQRNVGSVYVTNEFMPNPYAALPSYWDDLDRETQAECAGGYIGRTGAGR